MSLELFLFRAAKEQTGKAILSLADSVDMFFACGLCVLYMDLTAASSSSKNKMHTCYHTII